MQRCSCVCSPVSEVFYHSVCFCVTTWKIHSHSQQRNFHQTIMLSHVLRDFHIQDDYGNCVVGVWRCSLFTNKTTTTREMLHTTNFLRVCGVDWTVSWWMKKKSLQRCIGKREKHLLLVLLSSSSLSWATFFFSFVRCVRWVTCENSLKQA